MTWVDTVLAAAVAFSYVRMQWLAERVGDLEATAKRHMAYIGELVQAQNNLMARSIAEELIRQGVAKAKNGC